MPLKPLSKKVVGDLIDGKVSASSSFIIHPFENTKEKKRLAMEVMATGDGCCEVEVGDIVILPEGGWVVVTLKEDDGTYVKRISVPEKLLLAKVI